LIQLRGVTISDAPFYRLRYTVSFARHTRPRKAIYWLYVSGDDNTNPTEDLGRGRCAEFRSQPAVLMECRPSDYNGRYCQDGSCGVGHIPRPTSEMLIPEPNRERNGKEKKDGTT
jgi:hypothetical protein